MDHNEKLDLILKHLQVMGSDVQDIKSGMRNMEFRMQNMESRIQNIESRMQDMESRIQNIESRMQDMESRMQNIESETQSLSQKLTDVKLKLEKETNHNIQLLAENHSSLVDKLNQSIQISDKTLIWEVQLSGFRMRLENLENEFAELKSKMA